MTHSRDAVSEWVQEADKIEPVSVDVETVKMPSPRLSFWRQMMKELKQRRDDAESRNA